MNIWHEAVYKTTAPVIVNVEEVCAIFGVILLIFIMIDRKHNLKTFRVLAFVAVASDFIDIIATVVTFSINEDFPYAHLIVIILNTLNYFGFGFIAYTLFKYLKSYVRPSKTMHNLSAAVDGVFAIYSTLLVLNVLLPVHYIIDYNFDTGHFMRTPATYLIGYGLPLVVVTISISVMVLYNSDFSSKQKKTIAVGYSIVVAGCLIQAFVDARILFVHATGVVAIVILYFSLESPDYKRISALLKESQDAQERIREAQRAREDLFAGMTHEIRTPLNAVLGVNQLIAMEDNDPAVQTLTQRIRTEGDQALDVVNSILDQARGEDQTRKGDSATPELDGKNILSIDDTPINLKIIEGLLNQTGAAVTSVRSGREGIEKMMNDHYDLVVIDHQMPGMDGMATMKKMQSMGLKGDTPVIMVTGNDGEEYRKMYKDAGFDGYVKKPVLKEELFAVINRLVTGEGE